MSRPLFRKLGVVLLVSLAAIGAWELLRGVALEAAEGGHPGPVPPHYTCYVVEGEAPPQRTVAIRNQFEKAQIRVFSRQLLCVPTDKEPIHVEYAPEHEPDPPKQKPEAH